MKNNNIYQQTRTMTNLQAQYHRTKKGTIYDHIMDKRA